MKRFKTKKAKLLALTLAILAVFILSVIVWEKGVQPQVVRASELIEKIRSDQTVINQEEDDFERRVVELMESEELQTKLENEARKIAAEEQKEKAEAVLEETRGNTLGLE